MKVIQYILPGDYDKEKTLKTAGILFTKLMKTIKKINGNIEFDKEEFIIWPVSGWYVSKYKKIIMVGKDAGIPLMEALDEMYIADLEKAGLRVYRETFTK